jgi:hypothetical protein
MAILKIVPGVQFTKQLEEGCVRFGSIAINNRVALRFKQMINKVGDLIINVLNSTEVVKSLRGQGGIDLPAHFGLSDGDANGLVEGMFDLIRNSIIVGFDTKSNRGTITLKIIDTEWEKYTSLPGAQYISQPSSVTIPVVKWLLISPDLDPSTAAYQIVFEGSNMFRSKNSRSGRAIMVHLSKLGGGNSYVLPDIIAKTGGQNFIEGSIGQVGIAQRCAQIVIDEIK